MASEEENQQGDGKGFAGLSSMVSDVDATVAGTPKPQPRETSCSSAQQSSPSARPERQEQRKPTEQTYQPPAETSSRSYTGKWLFGIAAVIGLIWLFNQSYDNSSSKSKYSSRSSTTTVVPTAAKQQTAQPKMESRPSEQKPPVGRNNVLTTAQIRYCLAEKIRIDAAEAVIDNNIESEVDEFNGYVDDFNSRCAEYRYREGALEAARRDVEKFRIQLLSDGLGRFGNKTSQHRSAESFDTSQPYDLVNSEGKVASAISDIQSDHEQPVTQKPKAKPRADAQSDAEKQLPIGKKVDIYKELIEEKPSIGRNNVLSSAQIRYCLAEKIRLDAAESVINNYVESDVDRFNRYINDYNSRCGEFRYRQGALESARNDVESYRSHLQVEGRNRFNSSPSEAKRSQIPGHR